MDINNHKKIGQIQMKDIDRTIINKLEEIINLQKFKLLFF